MNAPELENEAPARTRAKHNGLSCSRPQMYGIWRNMVGRCYKTSHPQYESYGARGIEVAPEWRDDPQSFIDWIDENLGPRPEGKAKDGRSLYSLDRIDNSKGYVPGNLRWADQKMQCNNRRPRRWRRRPVELSPVDRADALLARADHIFAAVSMAVRNA